MPRQNVGRSIGAEANLAQRIARVRTEKGQSYESLADALTEVGCKINASSLYKIEKGSPPRQVSVDELVAFSQVWNLTIEDLLTPVEVLDEKEAQDLLAALRDADADLLAATERCLTLLAGLGRLAERKPDIHEYVLNHWVANPRGTGASDGAAHDLESDQDWGKAIAARATHDLHVENKVSLVRASRLWLDYAEGELSEGSLVKLHLALSQGHSWIEHTGLLTTVAPQGGFVGERQEAT